MIMSSSSLNQPGDSLANRDVRLVLSRFSPLGVVEAFVSDDQIGAEDEGGKRNRIT